MCCCCVCGACAGGLGGRAMRTPQLDPAARSRVMIEEWPFTTVVFRRSCNMLFVVCEEGGRIEDKIGEVISGLEGKETINK